jgi:hypothetical protein
LHKTFILYKDRIFLKIIPVISSLCSPFGLSSLKAFWAASLAFSLNGWG